MWNFKINKDTFIIGLSFENIKTDLEISYDSVISFADPYANFGLKLIPKKYNNKEDTKKNSITDSTEDNKNSSSNYLIKNLGNYKIFKSISNQLINSSFFSKILKKSITDEFTEDEINEFKSDMVISNATIEHVGSIENQIKMCENIIKLSNKYFIINTPNKFHPIEFHTKIPLIHWLPNKFYRIILKFLGLKFFADENNLNLLSENDLVLIMKKLNQVNFSIKKIKFLFFCSNLILIGKKY